MNRAVTMFAVLAMLSLPLAHAGGSCQVKSGPTTAALVELYTSEGCSSCPPADEALRAIRQSAAPHAVVIPLALHVSYWDQIGWKDLFAQKTFDTRQSMLVASGGGRVVYTPQFFVNGRELRNWQTVLPDTIGKVNSHPAKAAIALKSTLQPSGALLLEVVADARPTSGRRALFVAVSESQLVSRVTRGENSGATLRHGDTVRTWIGPIALENGKASLLQEIAVAPGWNPQRLQATAFVQDVDDGSVLQAVSTAQCGPSAGS